MYWVKNSAKGMSSTILKIYPFKKLKFREWKDDNLWQFQVAALLKAFLSFATAAPLTWIKECTEEEFWSFLFHSIDLIHFSSTRQKWQVALVKLDPWCESICRQVEKGSASWYSFKYWLVFGGTGSVEGTTCWYLEEQSVLGGTDWYLIVLGR